MIGLFVFKESDMLIKAGVDISRLKPQIRKKLRAIEQLFIQRDDELVITSTYEGTHSAGSLHYADLAIDTRYPRKYRGTIVDQLKAELGPDYDVVAEGDHIHIEYDPEVS